MRRPPVVTAVGEPEAHAPSEREPVRRFEKTPRSRC